MYPNFQACQFQKLNCPEHYKKIELYIPKAEFDGKKF